MTSDSVVRVARVLARTVAEGPGTRFAVWVQGCTIRCEGCFNPHMWNRSNGVDLAVETLIREAAEAGVEGVTLLGGEPFDQAGPLAEFAHGVQSNGLSVMTFSGYSYDELLARSASKSVASLLNATDLLVDGPYVADLPDLARPWVGSTNQQFRFLSDRYRSLEETLSTLRDRIEVRVTPEGQAFVNGWASVDALDALLEGIRPGTLRRGSIR